MVCSVGGSVVSSFIVIMVMAIVIKFMKCKLMG